MTTSGLDASALVGSESRNDELEQLRQLWVNADSESITADLERAHGLAASLPEAARSEGDTFLRAIKRLSDWLRSG